MAGGRGSQGVLHSHGVDGFSAPHVLPKQDVLIYSPALSLLSCRRWATTMGWQSQAFSLGTGFCFPSPPEATTVQRAASVTTKPCCPQLWALLWCCKSKTPPPRRGSALGSSTGSGVIRSKYEPWLCPRLVTLTFARCKMGSKRVPSYRDILRIK